MKRYWVNANPFDKEVVISALESGAEAVVVPDGGSGKVRELGTIKTVESGGDIVPGRDVVFIDIKSKEDENKAAATAGGSW